MLFIDQLSLFNNLRLNLDYFLRIGVSFPSYTFKIFDDLFLVLPANLLSFHQLVNLLVSLLYQHLLSLNLGLQVLDNFLFTISRIDLPLDLVELCL